MRSRSFLLLSVVVLVMCASRQGYAHHSVTAMYIQDQSVTIKGTVKEFLWRNPHSLFRVEVTDEKGQTNLWVVEGGSTAQLASDGINATSLRAKDEVIVTGRPGRGTAGKYRLLLQSVERPADGFKWKGSWTNN